MFNQNVQFVFFAYSTAIGKLCESVDNLLIKINTWNTVQNY